MATKPWSADDIPTQKGRISVVTGSTSGIGKETARVLAQKQSTVVLAVRNASSGDFFGPQDFFELHGAPIKVESSKQSHDVDAARKLWTLSEELTGIKY